MKIMRGIIVGAAVAVLSILSGCSSSNDQPATSTTSSVPSTPEVQSTVSPAEQAETDAIKRMYDRLGYNTPDYGLSSVDSFTYEDGRIVGARVGFSTIPWGCTYFFNAVKDPYAGWNTYKKTGGEIDIKAIVKAGKSRDPLPDANEYFCPAI